MIVSLHVATGGLAGVLSGSRKAALLVGPLAHLAGDMTPHHDIPSQRFESMSGVIALLALAAARGPLDPATLGAATAAAPDLEHVLPRRFRPRRKLFPSHRIHGLHRAGGLPAWLQLLAAGAILGGLLATARTGRRAA